MASFEPFEAASTATTGKTVVVISGSSGASISSTVDSTGKNNQTIYVVNQGPNMSWVRMSAEAPPTAAQTDIPMLGNSVYLFTNPVPNGALGVAVTVSVTTSPNVVWFTPGQGGV